MLRIWRFFTDAQRGPWSVVALLSAVVLLPTVGVLWFMGEAVRNERLAVRQRLAEADRAHLLVIHRQFQEFWRQRAVDLELKGTPSEIFAQGVRQRLADSLVILGDGRPAYPTLFASSSVGSPPPKDWEVAQRLERAGQPVAALGAYGRISRGSRPNAELQWVARAFQAQTRILAGLGKPGQLRRVVLDELDQPQFASVTDLRGRWIVPNALLMALHSSSSQAEQQIVGERLRAILEDYGEPTLPSPQRRFLMQQLLEALPEPDAFDTLSAEELAARYLSQNDGLEAFNSSVPPTSAVVPAVVPPTSAVVLPTSATALGGLQPSGLMGVWRLISFRGAAIGLYKDETILEGLRMLIEQQGFPEDLHVKVRVPFGASESTAEQQLQPSAALALGGELQGWQLELVRYGPFETASQRQIAFYRWTGLLTVLTILSVALLVAHQLSRQWRLTRLKNDLVANVSHELRTPLASIRLLVDTLLEAETLDPAQVRDYLGLIAGENERLSRLVENFLTFSRMEGGQQALSFASLEPQKIIEGVSEALSERWKTTGCRFELDMVSELPLIYGDLDALVTVVINLLDNACKYSAGEPEILLQVRTDERSVAFIVKDRGRGLTRRQRKQVFERFYQADPIRTADGGAGCGLGLSIVKHIVDAHGGDVEVRGRAGGGTTFVVRLPIRDDQGEGKR